MELGKDLAWLVIHFWKGGLSICHKLLSDLDWDLLKGVNDKTLCKYLVEGLEQQFGK